MPSYTPRRGREIIEEAAERKGGGDFKPFCPSIPWKDGDKRYVLILTPLDEVAEALVHEYVQIGTYEKDGQVKPKFEFFLSRKDRGIGERYDELEERLGNSPRLRIMGVGVELEPVMEPGRGGKDKLAGFTVKTKTYNKKGEDDEVIEVMQPEIGVISQSSGNFWQPLSAYDETCSVDETPFQIIRQGNDANTSYAFIHFMDQPVDFSNLLDYVDGVSYLTQDEDKFNDLIGRVDGAADDLEAAQVIAEALLTTRLEELADPVRYDEFVKPIAELPPSRFGAKKGASPKTATKTTRAPRRTRREATEDVASVPADEAPAAEAPVEAKAVREAKGERFAELRATAAAARSAAKA